MVKAQIVKYESLAALDGGGIRYAVFFQGCPLRCVYCHNPETWAKSDYPETTPEALVEKIKRYKVYFGDNGGVTFSGGEPLLRADFISECVPLLKNEGINYALDTSGAVAFDEKSKSVIKNAKTVILDIKFPSVEEYEKYCGDGSGFNRALETGGFCFNNGVKLLLRTVIVPGLNDSEAHMEKYADIASRFRGAEYELLAFHTLGFPKYEALGLKNQMEAYCDLPSTKLAALQNYLNGFLKIKADLNNFGI